MKLYAAIDNGKGITIRYQSCYYKLCVENGEFNFSCSGWNFHQLNFPSHHDDKDNDDDIIPVQCMTHSECEAGDRDVCIYDANKKNYFGKV